MLDVFKACEQRDILGYCLPKYVIILMFNTNTNKNTNTNNLFPPLPIIQQCRNCILHCNENPIYVFFFWELCGLSPNFTTFMFLRVIYIFPGSVHIFPNRRIGRSIVGTYKSLTDACGNWDCGRAIPFFGNICFQFPVLVLCNVYA